MAANLQGITNQVLSEVMKHDVVLPTLYQETFNKVASSLGVEVDNENMSAMVQHDIEKYYNIVHETSHNLEKLEGFTEEAHEAIVHKDEASMSAIMGELKKMQNELHKIKQELHTDTLTKCYNRRWLFETLLAEGKFPSGGALFFLDLNDFKIINDTHGHLLGDKVLVFFADFIRKSLSAQNDTLVRYAGDEFLVIHQNNDSALHSLKTFIERVRDELLHTKLKAKNDIIHIGFSYGIALFKTGDEFKTVLETADKQMYEDKARKKRQGANNGSI